MTTHPKLVARGNEVEDAGLKFKGAPADDCDPFAIQNYIDRLAAEVYDANPPKQEKAFEGKDEWEVMKEKAKAVPFQDVSLSIALKHGLLDEVKKENANKDFEKESILTIMKVRDEFLHEYAAASAFEYQWQIWVEWERYLKQIGVTIPQWGKVARKLIRIGVARIQDDMAKKYSQISNKRKGEDEEPPVQERRRRVTHPIEPYAAAPFVGFPTPMQRSSSFGGYMDPANPFASAPYSTPSTPYSSTPSTPVTPTEPYSPMQSPMATSPPFRPPFETNPAFSSPQPFGASLFNLIQTAPHGANIFSATASPMMKSPSLSNIPPSPVPLQLDPTQQSFTNYSSSSLSNPAASIPYPFLSDMSGLISSQQTIPYGITLSQSAPSSINISQTAPSSINISQTGPSTINISQTNSALLHSLPAHQFNNPLSPPHTSNIMYSGQSYGSSSVMQHLPSNISSSSHPPSMIPSSSLPPSMVPAFYANPSAPPSVAFPKPGEGPMY